MSKSRGNVVNPDEIVRDYGADTLRLYEMFIGDFEKAAPWNQNSVKGCKRFLERVFGLMEILKSDERCSPELEGSFHRTIKKVTDDIESLKFNTAIAAMMALLNDITAVGKITRGEFRTLLLLLNPFAPHVTEELWAQAGFGGMLNEQTWPAYDEAKCRSAQVEMAVQVCGKVRARMTVDADSEDVELLKQARELPDIRPYLEGKTVVKEIVVKGKLVNIVAK